MPEYKASRCMWIADDGTDWNGMGGCRRRAEDCSYAHPEDPQWRDAKPPRRRPDPHGPPGRGGGPGRGRGLGRGGGPPRDRDSGYGGQRTGGNQPSSSGWNTSAPDSGGWNSGGWNTTSGDKHSTSDTTAASNGWGDTNWSKAGVTANWAQDTANSAWGQDTTNSAWGQDDNKASRPDDEPKKSNWGNDEPDNNNAWASGSTNGWGDDKGGKGWGNAANESSAWGEKPAESSGGGNAAPAAEEHVWANNDSSSGWGKNPAWGQSEPEASPWGVSAADTSHPWANSGLSSTRRDVPSSTTEQATAQRWDEVMAVRERQPTSDAESAARKQRRPEPSEPDSRRGGPGKEPDVRDHLEPETPPCEPYTLDDDERLIHILILNSMEVMDEIKEAEEKVRDMRTLKSTEVFRRLNRAGRKNFVALFSNVKLCLAIARSKQKAYLDALAEIEPNPASAISQFQEETQSQEERPSGEQSLNYLDSVNAWIDDMVPPIQTFEACLVDHEANFERPMNAKGDAAPYQPLLEHLEDEASRLSDLITQNQDRLDALNQEIEENHLAHALKTFVDNKLASLQIEDEAEEGEQVIDTGFAYAEAEVVQMMARFAKLEVSRARLEEAGVSDALSYLEDDLTMLADEVQEADAAWNLLQQQAAALQATITKAQDQQQARSHRIMADFINQEIQADVVPEMEKIVAAVRKRIEAQMSQFRLEHVLDQASHWIAERHITLANNVET